MPGVKTTTKIYEETILEPIVKLFNDIFKGQHWILQQDSVPTYKSKHHPEWLANNIPAFIEGWTSGKPDVNPFDELWNILEQNSMSKTPFKFEVA